MKKKTVIWHIGLNKTGSTTLENVCLNSQNKLSSHNISFLSKAYFYQYFWGMYYQSDFSKRQLLYLKELFDHLIYNQIQEDKIIIIDEDTVLKNPFFEGYLIRYQTTFGTFHNNVDLILKRIKMLTKHVNLKIILYVRRQDLFLESLYNQNIKTRHHFSLTFSDFSKIYSQAQLNWFKLAKSIENIFGKDCLIIKNYTRNQLVKQDIVNDFFDILNIKDINNNMPGKDLNQKINQDYFEIIRAFNKIELPIHPKDYYRSCPKKYCKSNKPYGFMSFKERTSFLKKFEKSNRQLANHFFDKETLFESIDDSLLIVDQSKPIELSSEMLSQLKKDFYSL